MPRTWEGVFFSGAHSSHVEDSPKAGNVTDGKFHLAVTDLTCQFRYSRLCYPLIIHFFLAISRLNILWLFSLDWRTTTLRLCEAKGNTTQHTHEYNYSPAFPDRCRPSIFFHIHFLLLFFFARFFTLFAKRLVYYTARSREIPSSLSLETTPFASF